MTAEEFRVGACRECHDRGGYSLRFAAYVPITPHPEMGMCLQCHVGVDSVMGALVPGADPNTRCTQCHGPSGGRPRADASATWSAAVWPALGRRGGQKPLPIPHGLLFREDCNACHAGPGAVAEIRTSHPGRTYCRDCHVTQDPDVVSFDRRPRSAEPSAGDGR